MYHLVRGSDEVRTGSIFSFDGETVRLARADDFKRRDEVHYDLLFSEPLDIEKIRNYIRSTKSSRYDNDTNFWYVNTRLNTFSEASMNMLHDLEGSLAQGRDVSHLRKVTKITGHLDYVDRFEFEEVKTFIFTNGIVGEVKIADYLVTRA